MTRTMMKMWRAGASLELGSCALVVSSATGAKYDEEIPKPCFEKDVKSLGTVVVFKVLL